MRRFENAPLVGNERQAVEAVVKMLKEQFPIKRVILFGSKVRGDFDEYSDIDLLLITSRPLYWKEEKAIVDVLFDLGLAHDVIFSPLFASADEWESGIFKEYPIYREILKEGAIVP
jgi:predicted nucleotidyltransferase